MPVPRRLITGTAACAALSVSILAAGSLPSALAAASSASAAGPNAAAAATSTGWPTLRSGSAGVDVKTAQHLLREMSTLASPVGDSGVLVVDGRFGPATRQAVGEFQQRYGLVADGVIGRRTWEALIITVGRRSANSAVMALQVQLRALGHDVPVDGRYGAATTAAVVAVQRAAHLTPDGITGRATWRAVLVRTRG